MRIFLATILFALPACGAATAGLVTMTAGTTTTTGGGGATTQGGFSNGTHTFQNETVALTSLSAGANTYSAEFGFSKVDGTLLGTANLSKMYYFDGGTPIVGNSYSGAYKSDFDSLFDTPFQINVGSDNTLAETYDSVRIWDDTKLTVQNNDGLVNAGVSIVERGANDDDFRVRLITSLDGANDPDGFSAWFTVNAGDPFGTGLTLDGSSAPIAYDIYRDSTAPFDGEYLNVVSSGSQNIGAILITTDEFGLSIGDSFYGYEIAVLTTGGRAGLDLIPGGGVLQLNGTSGITASSAPEPSSIMLVCLGGLHCAFRRRKRLPVGAR